MKKADEQIRIVPQIQNSNQSDYRAVLSDIGVTGPCDAASYAGNRKIFRAFRYFQGRIEEMANGQSGGLAPIMRLLDKVNHACLVKIEVASHADAYTLFESLNNRGMPLTAVDLIKNKLLARLESIQSGKVDQYFAQWSRLLGYLGDDYSVQERFFRQYYNAFKDELKVVHQVPVATRSNLIQIYEKQIDHDAKKCLDKISSAGRLYSFILSRNQDDALNGLEKPLKDLERIQGAPAYLLLLYLLVKQKALDVNTEHLAEIVDLLVRFFVRRNLTDTPPTRDLNRLFMGMIDNVSGFSGAEVGKAIREQLIAASSSDETFRSKLAGPVYDENSGVTRFVLCALAERAMTRETLVDLWQIENKRQVWTIEHIFPQGKEIPSAWVAMMAGGDEAKARDIQETHVHRLGNLTISGFNSSLGNKSFAEKRDRKDRQGRPLGYRNGLKLNEDLAAAQGWSVKQIEARTGKLVDEAMDLFGLGGEQS